MGSQWGRIYGGIYQLAVPDVAQKEFCDNLTLKTVHICRLKIVTFNSCNITGCMYVCKEHPCSCREPYGLDCHGGAKERLSLSWRKHNGF